MIKCRGEPRVLTEMFFFAVFFMLLWCLLKTFNPTNVDVLEPQVPPGAIHIQPLRGCLTPFLRPLTNTKSA